MAKKKIMELNLVCPFLISVNNYLEYRVGHTRTNGKSYNKVIPYRSKETTQAYKEWLPYVKLEAEKQGWEIPDDNLFVVVETKYFFKKKRKDSNNFLKVPLDVISESGVVWKDDCVAYEVCKGVYYDNKEERIEMTLRVADQRGIFTDEKEMNNFEDVCNGCTYYREGTCGVLNKCKESRIIDSIMTIKGKKVCKKYKKKQYKGK